MQEVHDGERHGDQAEEDVGHSHADDQHIAGVPGDAVPEKKQLKR